MLHALNIIEIIYKLLKPVSLIKCMIKKISNYIFDTFDIGNH